MYVSPQGLLVAGDEPQLNPNDKGLIAAVLPHAVGARVVARGFYEPWAIATGQDILTTAAAGLPRPGVGTNTASTQTVRLYPTASGTSTVWEKPVKAVSVLLVFVKYGASGGTTPMFGNTAPNTAPYEAWALDDASGNLTFSYSAGGTYRSVTGGGGSIQVGRVNVALGTYDGATARLFLNGLLLNSASQTGDLVYPTAADRGPGLGNYWNFTGNSRSLVGRIFLGALWETGLPAERAIGITKSPQAAFEAVLGSRRIWAPIPEQAGSGSAISPAAGAAAASTLAGASTAAATVGQASGAATASTLAGSAVKAAAISSAAGVSTASTLVGAATKAATVSAAAGVATASTVAGASTAAAAISAAAGASTAGTLAGVTGTGANIGAAAGAATAESMAGAATAAAAISAASGAATASDIAGASTAAAAISAAAGAATAATLVGSTVGDASTISPAAGVASAQIIVGASFAAAAIGAATGAATCSALAGGGGLVVLSAPPLGHGPAATRRTTSAGRSRAAQLSTRTR